MSVAPCKDCQDREPGCHSHCIGYKRWKAEQQKEAKEYEEDRKALSHLEGWMRYQQQGRTLKK